MANNLIDAAIRLRDLFTPTVRSVNASLGTMKSQMAAALGLARATDSLTMQKRAGEEAARGIKSGARELSAQTRAYAEAACRFNGVYVRAQEQELPAVFRLLPLYHLLHGFAVVTAAGVLHAVRSYYEQSMLRHVLLPRVLMYVAYVVYRSANRVQQCRAAAHIVFPVRHRLHAANGYAIVNYLAEVIEQHGRYQRLPRLFLLLFYH